MMDAFFGLHSYDRHMTNEGWQFQDGMRQNGWHLMGPGFADSRSDIAAVLRDDRPERVFIQDHREWHRGYPGAFDEAAHFDNHKALADHIGPVATLLKDAHQDVNYEQFHIDVGVTHVVHYYHEMAIEPHCPWLFDVTWGVKLIRTYHTVNLEEVVPPFEWPKRRDWCVSGARARKVYPLRHLIKSIATAKGGTVLPHPGYNLSGWQTPVYLSQLTNYKVSVCTASRYQYLLRKIIESVAAGCTVITDLPAWDKVPDIEEGIVRMETPDRAGFRRALERSLDEWTPGRAERLAHAAVKRFDYVTELARVNEEIR